MVKIMVDGIELETERPKLREGYEYVEWENHLSWHNYNVQHEIDPEFMPAKMDYNKK